MSVIRTGLDVSELRLPLKFSNGTVLRFLTAEEHKSIQSVVDPIQLSKLKQVSHDGRILCLDGSEVCLPALSTVHTDVPIALLFHQTELQVHSSFRFSEKAKVVGTMQLAPSFYANSHWPNGTKPINRIERPGPSFVSEVDAVLSQRILDSDFGKGFLSTWLMSTNSPFRFVALISLIEGMVGNEVVKDKRANLSSKMAFFYRQVFPYLSIKAGMTSALPHVASSADLGQLWTDLYKVRNHLSHGGQIDRGQEIGQFVSGLGQIAPLGLWAISEIALHGVKSLLLWHLQAPEAQSDFRSIV